MGIYDHFLRENLRIEVLSAANVHWSADNGETSFDNETKDTGLGIFITDIDWHNADVKEVKFTFFWRDSSVWENKNFAVKIE